MKKIRLTRKRISILTNMLSTLESHIQSIEMTLSNKKFVESLGSDDEYILELKAELPTMYHAYDVIRVYINRYAGFKKGYNMRMHTWEDETEITLSDFELAYNSITIYYNSLLDSNVLQKEHKEELKDQLKFLDILK